MFGSVPINFLRGGIMDGKLPRLPADALDLL
jgi:hypothetical protein